MTGVSDTNTSSCELYGQPVDTNRLAKRVCMRISQPISVLQVSQQEVTNGTGRVMTVRKGGVARRKSD